MTPGELRVVTLAVPAGVPFRREIQPTSYLYNMSVTTTAGFVPFLEVPCEAPGKCPSSDSRFLGAMIHVIPEYTDADITRGWVPPGGVVQERKTRVGYSTHLEAKVARKVTKAIHDFNLIEDGDRVMVGLSGGKDSWALIQILDVLRKRAPDQLFDHRRQHRLGLRRLSARHHQGHVRRARLGVPRRAHDHRRSDGRSAGGQRDAVLAVRAPAPRRALSAGRQGRRDEDRARPSRGRLHRDAPAESVLRGQPQGDAGAGWSPTIARTSSFARWCM